MVAPARDGNATKRRWNGFVRVDGCRDVGGRAGAERLCNALLAQEATTLRSAPAMTSPLWLMLVDYFKSAAAKEAKVATGHLCAACHDRHCLIACDVETSAVNIL